MNYYLVDCENPNERLRHYKNTRVAYYTRNQLNEVAGFEKYKVICDDEPVVTLSVKRTSFEVPAEQVFGRLS